MLDPESMSAIAIRYIGVGTRNNTRGKHSARRVIFCQEVSDLTGQGAGTVTVY
jgi:hypothetical protein